MSRREAIIAKVKDARILPVTFAGEEFFVKSLPVKEILRIRRLPTNEEQSFALVLACSCEKDKTPIFTADDADLFDVSEAIDLTEANELVSLCLTVNRLNKEGFKEAQKK